MRSDLLRPLAQQPSLLPSLSSLLEGLAWKMGFSKNESCVASSPEVDKSELAMEKRQLSDVAMSRAVTSDNIWWIHGNGYDLTKFVERHPGGQEAILLGRGRDCTALFESYHIFSNDHW